MNLGIKRNLTMAERSTLNRLLDEINRAEFQELGSSPNSPLGTWTKDRLRNAAVSLEDLIEKLLVADEEHENSPVN